MRKVVLFCILFFIFSKIAFAETKYFDHAPKSRILTYNDIMEVTLKYELTSAKEDRFVIRPCINQGAISILNPITGVWIPGKVTWNKLPFLQDKFLIRIENMQDSPTELSFLIQDTKTARIYETSKKSIWGYAVWGNYVSNLNENILGWGNENARDK